MIRIILALVLLALATPLQAQSVLLGQYPPGQTTASASLPVILASDQTLPLPSGAATESTLSGLLTNQQSVLTAVQLLDNIVLAESATHSSGEPGVLLLGVRNDAGSALATDGQRIPLSLDSAGAVRVTGGGGGTQYQEGDTDASITGTAMLWEDTSDTLRPVAAGTPLPVTCATCSGTGVQHIDDAAFAVTSDDGVPIFGLFDDVAPDSVNEGDGGVVRMSSNRVLYTTIRDAAGNERGLNIDANGALAVGTFPDNEPFNLAQIAGSAVGATNPLFVRWTDGTTAQTGAALDLDTGGGTVTRISMGLAAAASGGPIAVEGTTANGLEVDVTRVQGTVTVDTELASASALADNTANPTVSGLAAFLMCFDGSTWDRCLAAATTELTHDGAITPGSTVALSTMFRASATEPTNVSADNDAVLPWASLAGALMTSIRDSQGDDATDTTNDAIRVNIVAGSAAGGTSSSFGASFPASGTAIGLSDGTNMVAALATTTQADNLANTLDGLNTTTFAYWFDGSTWDRASGNSTDGLLVNLGANNDVTIAGTVTLAATTNTIEVVGDAAHDAAVSGNPVLMGFASSAAAPTDVSADGEVVRPWALRNGALAIQPTFSGTLAAVNNGGVSAGTLRVTIANDSTGILATVGTVTTLSQFAGNAINLGSGTIGTGTLRITIATDDPVNDALVNLDVALNADEGAFTYATTQTLAIGAVAESTSDSLADGTVGAVTMTLDRKLYTAHQDPCSRIAKTYFTIDIVTATTTEIANAVASEFFYICSIDLHTNAANNVVIAEDDTDGCGSISAGVTGGTTAAEGYTFGANGGRTLGNGMGAVAKTTTANRYLCILTSASTQLSGVISYVSAP